MTRSIDPAYIRAGMNEARKRYSIAPDRDLLVSIATTVRDEVAQGTPYLAAVDAALLEMGIEESMQEVFYTALQAVLGPYANEALPRRRPVVVVPLPSCDETAWKRYFSNYAGHLRDAQRMKYQRRDHLLDDL